MRMHPALKGAALALILAGLAGPAAAVPLSPDGLWHAFDVDLLSASSGGVEWIDLADGSPLTFGIDIGAGQHAVLTVVDGGFAGDRFRVIDGTRSLGLTSPATDSAPDSVSTDFDAALADTRYSRGVFHLGAGHHEITGALDRSALYDGVPLDASVGAVRLSISAIPEPATWAGLLAGLGLVGAVARRRATPRPGARAAMLATGLLATSVAGSACAATTAAARHAAPIHVKIIAINDFHGALQSPGSFGQSLNVPPAQRPAVGGADVLASQVARLKAQNPLNVVVGAGDLISASPLISALFHDEPAVEVLNRVGLEFSSVGNHEFDKGTAELKRLQSGGCKTVDGVVDAHSCQGASVGTPVPFEGAKYRWLSANVIETRTGRPFFPPYGIKSFDGVRVGFIGMTLKDTPTIVTPSGVAGLEFRDEAQTVNALVPRLRALGVEAIVVLVHQGGFQSGAVQDINGCDGQLAGSAIADIVGRLDNAVDLVVSAHTHAAYNCRLPNAKGRAIPVTSASAFGRVLTDIDVTLDPATRRVTAIAPVNRLVDRDPAVNGSDPAVAGIVNAYAHLVSPIANEVIGSISRDLSPSAVDAACNVPAGDLIADSQLDATSPKGYGEAQIAFMNRGGVRSPGFTFPSSSAGEGDGNVTYGEAFTVQPFGNSLVTMTLTAQDLKHALEQQFAGCRGQAATASRLLLPSVGFKYTWDGSRACDARVRNVTLTRGGVTETIVDASGTVVNPAKTYRVTVNNFLSTGGDGFTTFNDGTDRLGGAQDIDALVVELGRYKAPAAPYVPNAKSDDRGTARIQRTGGTTCPTGADVNP